MTRLTRAALERELRKLLASGVSGVSLRAMRRQAAYTYVDQHPHPITVDTYQLGKLSAVVHELVHCTREELLEPWGDFEEDMVWAVTRAVCEHISARPRLDEQWRKLIEQLEGSNDRRSQRHRRVRHA